MQLVFLSCLVGIGAALSTTVFLTTLNWVTEFQTTHLQTIWGLPLAGLLIGWLYQRWARQSLQGLKLILNEIKSPQKTIPLLHAPLLFGATLLTHFCGGSAGREGTAVQMATALADQISNYFKASLATRRNLLIAGMAAGFGATIGTPWAGLVFGLEVNRRRQLTFNDGLASLIASWVGFQIARILKAPHRHFYRFDHIDYQLKLFIAMGLAALAFGLAAALFWQLTQRWQRFLNHHISSAQLRPLLGGTLVLGLYLIINDSSFLGLGLPVISQAFQQSSALATSFLKMIFTTLTISSGFKGGEFIPLVFIGSTLGSGLAHFLPTTLPLLTAVGFAAVFAGVAHTPLACAVMSAELFGWGILPYALLGCFISSFWALKLGVSGIYTIDPIK